MKDPRTEEIQRREHEGKQSPTSKSRVFIYLHVHVCQADEHPGYEAVPEARRNEAHFEKPLQSVVGLLLEALQVHGWLWREEMREQVAAGNTPRSENTTAFMTHPIMHCVLGSC